MNIFESRFFRLFQSAKNLKELSQQNEALRKTLISAIQDIAVLKAMLREKELWDDVLYRRLRVEQMIEDRNTAGIEPWTRCSYYPYTLEEREFLLQVFKANEAEIRQFDAEIERVSTLT